MKAFALALAGVLAAAPSPSVLSATRFRTDVTCPAADARMGRYPVGPGYAAAADYVARAFADAGLRPAGDRGFFQLVPLVRYRIAGPARAVWAVPGQPAVALRAGVDFYPEADPAAPAQRVSAPVVFVGEGIVHWRRRDDYRGLDVRGRIVAARFGGDGIDDPVDKARSWDMARKRRTARAGQSASSGCTSTAPAVPRSRPGARSRPIRRLAGGPAATPILATISEAGAARLFGPGWQKRRGESMAGATLTIATATRIKPVPSRNVVGRLPGSDPRQAGEAVVVSAHLDHLGGAAGPGDRINNGALDNAIGVAILMYVARRLA